MTKREGGRKRRESERERERESEKGEIVRGREETRE
jgi:hypothetical protein